jgi:hypothetical protein
MEEPRVQHDDEKKKPYLEIKKKMMKKKLLLMLLWLLWLWLWKRREICEQRFSAGLAFDTVEPVVWKKNVSTRFVEEIAERQPQHVANKTKEWQLRILDAPKG